MYKIEETIPKDFEDKFSVENGEIFIQLEDQKTESQKVLLVVKAEVINTLIHGVLY